MCLFTFFAFYSTVYKCVCQQLADKMYSSLIDLVTTYLRRVTEELQVIYLSMSILELKNQSKLKQNISSSNKLQAQAHCN